MWTFPSSRAIALSLLLAAVGCSAPSNPTTSTENVSTGDSATQSIVIDGSSTVYPISDEVAKEYQFEKAEEAPFIEVLFSGTGGGFRKFCAGETDINDASRPISVEEMEACREAGVEYIELPVAFDALTVVVHPDNDWAESITVEELKMLWEPQAEGTITSWNQIRSEWPDTPINLYGPGVDSEPSTISLRRSSENRVKVEETILLAKMMRS